MKSLQDDQPTGFSKLCGLFSIGLTIDFISISQYPEVKSSTFLLNQSWIPICCFFPIPRTNPTRSGWWYTYPFEKWWSSTVGMMTFPTEWKNKIHFPNHQSEIIVKSPWQSLNSAWKVLKTAKGSPLLGDGKRCVQSPPRSLTEIGGRSWWFNGGRSFFWLEVDKHGSKWVNKDYGWKLAFQWISVG